jgi:DnaJ-class molecular chaperone
MCVVRCGLPAVVFDSSTMPTQVQPGWKDGTRVSFFGDSPGGGSVVCVLKELAHSVFSREGNNLLYTCEVTEEFVSDLILF